MAPSLSSPATTTFFIILIPSLFIVGDSALSINYYSKSCPRFAQIIQEIVTDKQITHPTTAAATLRLFFHDCFATGCDASTLVSPTPLNPTTERTSPINLSLPGDAFDLIVRIKTALELACPATVSCSDILAVATRDLVTMVGGPFYPVYLGRRDTRFSKPTSDAFIPLPNATVTGILTLFASRGFSAAETVALLGAHTIGFSHCSEFAAGVYSSPPDRTYNPRFAAGLRSACRNYRRDPTLSVFNDIMTPNKFDNEYYKNLQKGLGLLASDRAIYGDRRTRPFVEIYAKYPSRFFKAFAGAMQKMSVYGIKTGRRGEIRRRCDAIN